MITHKHHIIPRHAGGSDDPANLVELTVEEHANAHKLLYEQEGRWQDKLAWQALSGQISMSEASKLATLKGGDKGRENLTEEGRKSHSARATRVNLARTPEQLKEIGRKISVSMKGKRTLKHTYTVVSPDGAQHIVDDLITFCNYNSLSKSKMYSIASPNNEAFGHKHKGFQCFKCETGGASWR